MGDRKRQEVCYCPRQPIYMHEKKRKDPSTRKRQTFVFNTEEEIWHEPYMHPLKKELSNVSIRCDSKIELPWKDIALPVKGLRIRTERDNIVVERGEGNTVEDSHVEVDKKESTGAMVLPWQDLLISETIESNQNNLACDSTLEIPWNDLTLDKPININPPLETESCSIEDVEIPWGDILIPKNISIEIQKKKKHPSSMNPPRNTTNCLRQCVSSYDSPCRASKKRTPKSTRY